jgi:hypothetical protein
VARTGADRREHPKHGVIDLGAPPGEDDAGAEPGRRAAASRLTERHVLALGLGAAGAFVVAAIASAAAASIGGGTPWAAIHLALAGAAVVAIGAFMPHFAVTLAGTRPAPALQRLTSLALLAAGAGAVVTGMLGQRGGVAGAGAIAVLAGLGLVAIHTFAPLRDPLARRHPVVALVYGVALAELVAGVTLGGLAAWGADPILGAWASLRPIHAWLNLFGAVSLTIFGTLVYLAPTVFGARIRATPYLALATAGLLVGPLVTITGFAIGSGPVVVAGMLLTLAGATGQLGYVVETWTRRGPFTSEHDWRRAAIGHLVAGPVWLWLAIAAAIPAVVAGSSPAGWSLGVLAVPMIAGWMLQELVGSWTHLAPSVTPGTAARHAAQRRELARAARLRLIGWNLGVGSLWVGLATDAAPLTGLGAALVGGAALLSVALLARSLVMPEPALHS